MVYKVDKPRAISTNTLLAEGDAENVVKAYMGTSISTNTLLAEGDLAPKLEHKPARTFQPTPSSRRVTVLLARR